MGAQRTNTETLLYVSLHLIPYFFFNAKMRDRALFVFMLFLGGIYIQGNMFHINPTWHGWGIKGIRPAKCYDYYEYSFKNQTIFNLWSKGRLMGFLRGTDNILD